MYTRQLYVALLKPFEDCKSAYSKKEKRNMGWNGKITEQVVRRLRSSPALQELGAPWGPLPG